MLVESNVIDESGRKHLRCGFDIFSFRTKGIKAIEGSLSIYRKVKQNKLRDKIRISNKTEFLHAQGGVKKHGRSLIQNIGEHS